MLATGSTKSTIHQPSNRHCLTEPTADEIIQAKLRHQRAQAVIKQASKRQGKYIVGAAEDVDDFSDDDDLNDRETQQQRVALTEGNNKQVRVSFFG